MPDERLSLVLLVIAKWFTYFGLFSSIGCLLVSGILRYLGEENALSFKVLAIARRRLRVFVSISVAVLFVSCIGRLYAQSYSVFGFDGIVSLEMLELVAIETRWGQEWLLQFVSTAVLCLCVLITWYSDGFGFKALTVGLVLVVVSLPRTGHVMAHLGDTVMPWVLQAGHLMAAGLWLGGLITILALISTKQLSAAIVEQAIAKSLIAGFSPVAVVSVACVVVSGVSTGNCTSYQQHLREPPAMQYRCNISW